MLIQCAKNQLCCVRNAVVPIGPIVIECKQQRKRNRQQKSTRVSSFQIQRTILRGTHIIRKKSLTEMIDVRQVGLGIEIVNFEPSKPVMGVNIISVLASYLV